MAFRPVALSFRLPGVLGLAFGVSLSACGTDSPAAPSGMGGGATGQRLRCPAPIEVYASTPAGAEVAYLVPAPIDGLEPVTVSCAPASKTLFPRGMTQVTCSATDAAGVTGTCSFQIHVQGRPRRLAQTRLLAFGDSLTEGVTFSSSTSSVGVLGQLSQSYPAVLAGLLADRYRGQDITVLNLGLHGESIEDGRARLQETLREKAADTLLLMHGVNDLNLLGFVGASSSRVMEVSEVLDRMVGDARSAGVEVLLATLPPQRPGGERALSAHLVGPYNDQVRQIASRHRVKLVDVASAYGGNLSLIGPDGLHPTAAGHARTAEAFLSALRQAFEVTGPEEGSQPTAAYETAAGP